MFKVIKDIIEEIPIVWIFKTKSLIVSMYMVRDQLYFYVKYGIILDLRISFLILYEQLNYNLANLVLYYIVCSFILILNN